MSKSVPESCSTSRAVGEEVHVRLLQRMFSVFLGSILYLRRQFLLLQLRVKLFGSCELLVLFLPRLIQSAILLDLLGLLGFQGCDE